MPELVIASTEKDHEMSRNHGGKLLVGVVLLHLLCCGLPLLLAAGALGGVGAVLSATASNNTLWDSAVLLLAAGTAVLAALAWGLRRVRRRREDGDCCAPEHVQVPAQRASTKAESQ